MSKAKTIEIEPTLSKKSISTMSDVTDIIKSTNRELIITVLYLFNNIRILHT